jgi:ubiquinone/menaquinone biosynthesis C-methylase UbiE
MIMLACSALLPRHWRGCCVSNPSRPAPDGRLRILEIGCGTGLLTRQLRSLFQDAEIVATDISLEMIRQAERGWRYWRAFSGDGW